MELEIGRAEIAIFPEMFYFDLTSDLHRSSKGSLYTLDPVPEMSIICHDCITLSSSFSKAICESVAGSMPLPL